MSARITQRIILRWGWGVWEGARLDAKRLAGASTPELRRIARDRLRSLERTRAKCSKSKMEAIAHNDIKPEEVKEVGRTRQKCGPRLKGFEIKAVRQ